MRRTCVSLTLVGSMLWARRSRPRKHRSPSLSPAAMEEFLRTAELSDIRYIGEGVTRARRAVASDGRFSHDVHIQSVDERRASFAVAGAPVEINFTDSYAYNIAAYRLAVLLGMDNVPMSVPRMVTRERAAVTWWVDDVAMTERERADLGTYGPNPGQTVQQLYTMYVFDELIQNRDRNQGNILWTSDWKLWLIDHTRAFRPQVEIAKARPPEPSPPLPAGQPPRADAGSARRGNGRPPRRPAAIEIVAETRSAGTALRRAHRQARRRRAHREVAVASSSRRRIRRGRACPGTGYERMKSDVSSVETSTLRVMIPRSSNPAPSRPRSSSFPELSRSSRSSCAASTFRSVN